jgi:hypothetical protein
MPPVSLNPVRLSISVTSKSFFQRSRSCSMNAPPRLLKKASQSNSSRFVVYDSSVSRPLGSSVIGCGVLQSIVDVNFL